MLRKISIAIVVIGVALCALAGISVNLNPMVEKVSFTETEKTLTINTSHKLNFYTYPENARLSASGLEWSSSDTNVAVVDKYGNVDAVGVGTVTIKAKYKTNTIECAITVNPVFVSHLNVSYPYSIIHPAETMQIAAIVKPDNATYKQLTWSSSNPEVATVSNTGLVTGVAEGETLVTINAANDVTETLVVKVQNTIEVESIDLSINVLDPTKLWLSTFNITPTIFPANADNQTLTWSSSNSEVISVDSAGKVTTHKDGFATITATSLSGKTASIYLNVPRVEATSVNIVKPSVSGATIVSSTISVGTTLQLRANLTRGISSYPYITSSGITTHELEWTSSDPSKVSVSQGGLVTAIASTANGTGTNFGVTITVTVKGVGISDSYIIMVK